MKLIHSFKSALALLGLVGALCSATIAHAQLSYLVDINTSSIVNHSAGPFALDFQSIAGSGTQTITLSNFGFTGGGVTGAGDYTGAISGDLVTSLVLNPNSGSFFNEFFQQLDPTVSNISFMLNLTTNSAAPDPTSFNVAILDSSMYNIPTTQGSPFNTLLQFDINGGSTNYQTFTSIGDTSGVTLNVTAIPEPSTYALLTGLTVLTAGVWRRRVMARA